MAKGVELGVGYLYYLVIGFELGTRLSPCHLLKFGRDSYSRCTATACEVGALFLSMRSVLGVGGQRIDEGADLCHLLVSLGWLWA